MLNETKRDIVERRLMDRLGQIQPYGSEHAFVIERYQDGSYGMSKLAFALYSNGRNPRGRSSNYPCGLVFEDDKIFFSIGYYRKELDPEDSDGYLFIVSPRGKNIAKKIGMIVEQVKDKDIPCNGVYARFLKLDQYLELLDNGFLPIEESPWHPEYPKEDETYFHSIVNIENPPTKKSNYARNRFRNFLDRRGFEYKLRLLSPENSEDAKQVVDSHFEFLMKNEKAKGSVPEDHYNSLNIAALNFSLVHGYIGYLQDEPVSVFIGEALSPRRFGLYTPFTLRDHKKIPCLNLDSDLTGFTAMPTYAYMELFDKLKKGCVSEVHLGGSESPDLNRFKRQLGAKEDPTYWAFKPTTS
jgi:hypothetical protein